MKKEGLNELKKLFEQKQKKENNNSSSKNKKKKEKEKKEDKKKQEKLKKENTKQDFSSQRTFTLTGSEIESVRNSLVKNVNKNDKNDKVSNISTSKEAENELDKIKNKLVRTNTNFNNLKDTKAEGNGGVKNTIQNFNTVNENKDNKKETNNAKNIISNLNKDANKNGNNKEVKNEIKDAKANVTNINNKDNQNDFLMPKRAETAIDSKIFNSALKDNDKMEIKSLIKTNNKTINENEKKVFEKSFDRFVSLQTLLKKESSLKELCK